jgi:hypothetical protein
MVLLGGWWGQAGQLRLQQVLLGGGRAAIHCLIESHLLFSTRLHPGAAKPAKQPISQSAGAPQQGLLQAQL